MSSDIASEAAPAGLSGHAFSSLFQAVTGLRNRRALVAMLGCMFVGVIVVGLLVAMTGSLGLFAGLLATVVWVVAIGTGVNAAGLLQMDHARGISPRSIADALVYGLMCIPKLIVLGLIFVAVEIAVFLVLAVLLFICKIPFLGPLLFVVVFPLSVVVAGVTIVGLILCMVLSLPAIWQGASITRALAQTFAIVRSRLLEAVLLLIFVGFLAFAVAMIIFGVLGFGLVPTLGMSMSIVGFGGFGMESMMAMSQGGGGGAGHAIAGAIGGALLWAVAASLIGQVYLLGLSLVYLRVTEGLDLTASEEALARDLRRRQAAHRRARREGAPGDAAQRRRWRGDRRGGRRCDGERRARGACAGLQPAAGVQPAAGIRTNPAAAPSRRRGTDDDRADAAATHRPAIPTSSCLSTSRRRQRRRGPVVCRAAGVDAAAGRACAERRAPARASAAAGADDVRAMPVAGIARGCLLRRLRLPAEVASTQRALS